MRLKGHKIAILMESDFYEDEILYYKHRFPEEGLETHFLTRLWGTDRITFHGHEYKVPFEVSESFEGMSDDELRSYSAIIVPSAIVSDRLRYSEDVNKLAPATEFMKRAFAEKSVVKGIICHGMWLVSAAPELVRGRPVVAHNNLIGDVRNMGAVYTDQDVVVDDDLVTARTGGHCHLFARAIIDLIVERSAAAGSERGTATSAGTAGVTTEATAGTAGITTTATAGTPAATGPGAGVPTNVERFAASSPTTAGGAATRAAAGSGSAAPVDPSTSASAVPGRRVEANMPAAAGPVGPTPVPPASTPHAGA
jgi:protease I